MDNLPQRLSFHVVHLDAATRCRIAQPAQLYRPYLDGLEDCNFQFDDNAAGHHFSPAALLGCRHDIPVLRSAGHAARIAA